MLSSDNNSARMPQSVARESIVLSEGGEAGSASDVADADRNGSVEVLTGEETMSRFGMVTAVAASFGSIK